MHTPAHPPSRPSSGFDLGRWQALESVQQGAPWQYLPEQVHRTSEGLPWRGLRMWHQIGPAGDLYVPPSACHSILLRRASATELVQRHGRVEQARRWQPSEALIVPAGLPSFWRSAVPRDNIRINIDPTWLRRAADTEVQLHSCFGRHDPVLEGFGQLLLASLDSNTSLLPSFADTMATGIALHLLENYATTTAHRPPRTATLSRRQMAKVSEALEASLHEPWPVARMAALVDLSLFHFTRAFKASFGATPHGHVTALRMDMAARLLRETRQPIADVALATGYVSVTHFSQAFRRHWGMTPAAHRREL